jgi:hypothetical protein
MVGKIERHFCHLVACATTFPFKMTKSITDLSVEQTKEYFDKYIAFRTADGSRAERFLELLVYVYKYLGRPALEAIIAKETDADETTQVIMALAIIRHTQKH